MASAPFEVVQSDIADSADEIAVDPLSSESDDTCFPPSSNHANAASAKKPHKPKKTKKSSNQHGGKDVDLDRLSDSFQLPVKRSHKCAKARSGNVWLLHQLAQWKFDISIFSFFALSTL